MSSEHILVAKQDLTVLQQRGFFKSSADTDAIWNELKNRCPLASSDSIKQEQIEVVIPPIQGNFRESLKYDICIAYSPKNGASQARLIMNLLETEHLKVVLATPNEKDNLSSIEKKVAQSTALVVLLTEKSLQELEVVFAMTCAKFHFHHVSQIILVHDAASRFFPGYNEQPPSLTDVFSEKAITFLPCYAIQGIRQIIDKFESEKAVLHNTQAKSPSAVFSQLLKSAPTTSEEIPATQFRNIVSSLVSDQTDLDKLISELDQNQDGNIDIMEFSDMINKSPKFASLFADTDHEEAPEDLTTRFFLSHKRSTGQGIAGRLFEGLRGEDSVFLDSEAKFKIHNLQQIVEQTGHFIFILTPGIFLSKWCLEELKSAVANKKQITIVRELGYSLPEVLPPEWQPFDSLIRSPEELIWMAEYNQACIDAIRLRTGPSEYSLKKVSVLLPFLIRRIEEDGFLRTRHGLMSESEFSLAAFFWLTRDRKDIWAKIKTLEIGDASINPPDYMFFSGVKLPNLERILCPGENFSGDFDGIEALYPCLIPENIKVLDCPYIVASKFSFPNVEKYTTRGSLASVMDACGPGLKTLRLRVEEEIQWPEKFAEKFQQLQELQVKAEPNVLLDFSISIPSLTSLHVAAATDENFLQTIHRQFPNLEKLVWFFSGVGQPKMTDMISIAGTVFDKITHLTVEVNDAADVKAVIDTFPNLEELDIEVERADSLPDLSQLKRLKKLILCQFNGTMQTCLSVIPLVPQLESLQVKQASTELIECIAQNGKNLKSFATRDWPNESLYRVSSPGFANLQSIEVGSACFKAQFCAALVGLKNLKRLKLFRPESLEPLVPLFPQLQDLVIIRGAVPSTFIDGIANAKNLECLQANFSDDFPVGPGEDKTATVICELWKRLPKLKDIQIDMFNPFM